MILRSELWIVGVQHRSFFSIHTNRHRNTYCDKHFQSDLPWFSLAACASTPCSVQVWQYGLANASMQMGV